jgi:hypothetical protein
MQIKGIMIDCSRLIELHEYYFSLLDFMQQWGLNTLLLHFTDDHGCAVELPSFPELQFPHAFSVDEVHRFIEYASERGISVIPEIETFGHTRFLTDHPRYADLYFGEKTEELKFNALDPLNPRSLETVRRLITDVCALFPSEIIHIGCDEVDISQLKMTHPELDLATVWTDYVNSVIALVRDAGCEAMMWADHPAKDPAIAAKLRKDVVLVDWQYEAQIDTSHASDLKAAGFTRFIAAPALASYWHRFLIDEATKTNTRVMIDYAIRGGFQGLINTIWCPYRYFQKMTYYGIAYTAYLLEHGTAISEEAFHREFASRVFGLANDSAMLEYLKLWPKMALDAWAAGQLFGRPDPLPKATQTTLQLAAEIAVQLEELASSIHVNSNRDIWEEMHLAAQAVGLFARTYTSPSRANTLLPELDRVRLKAAEIWDRDRYSDSPQKYASKFKGADFEYALPLLERLHHSIRETDNG